MALVCEQGVQSVADLSEDLVGWCPHQLPADKPELHEASRLQPSHRLQPHGGCF